MGEKPADVTAPAAYAREIETYLCRKNGGHLIRVVGPAFELVRSWATQGVPLKVAFRGIDRCCERHDRKGTGRRRPVRIEFCEADVLEAFDDWRRAVGVGASGTPDRDGDRASRKPPLTAHIERAIARLAYARGAGAPVTGLHLAIDGIIRELEEIVSAAARSRGDARASLISRLAELDLALMEAAVSHIAEDRRATLRAEAVEEIAPFASRLPAEARDRAIHAAFVRLVREHSRLPALSYE